MDSISIVWILIAFFIYISWMVIIGAKYAGGNTSTEDYLLGGRGLNAWVAALSAQASDMSGWLLMGLPGAIYFSGMGEGLIAVGLLIGTSLNWIFISKRLRRYTIKAGNSLTLPAYFENRFKDSSKTLLFISSLFIVIFFLIYTASALASGGKLFNAIFGIDYIVALTIGTGIILVYTFLGGFMAVSVTDFVQGLLMLVALITVPMIAYFTLGGDNFINLIEDSNVSGGVSSYLNIFNANGNPIKLVNIVSNLSWGLGYFGMPHILARFIAISSEKELKKSRIIGIVWVILSLSFACFIGLVGRAYLMPVVLGEGGAASVENVFIEMILKMFTTQFNIPFIAGIFLCGVIAAIMSTADSQLLVTASSVSEDLYKGFINKKASDANVLLVSRITVVIVAVLAYIIALDPNSSVMKLVSNAWAGFGATFGPIVILSLFWRRCTRTGAIAGMLSGGVSVLVWDYLPIGGTTLSGLTSLYSLPVGFFISIAAIIVFSLLSKEPDEEILQAFDSVANESFE